MWLYLPCTDWFGTKRTSICVLNQSENGIYNLISVWFNKISKIFLCVQRNTPTITFKNLPRHYRGPIEGPLKPLKLHDNMVPRGFRVVLNCSSIMPRGISSSDSWFGFFFSLVNIHSGRSYVINKRHMKEFYRIITTLRLSLVPYNYIFSITSIMAWNENPIRRTSEHNHICITRDSAFHFSFSYNKRGFVEFQNKR